VILMDFLFLKRGDLVMKMKHRRLISLILIIVIAIAAAVPALAMETPPSSEWAVPFMRRANQAGLLTPSAARDPRADLTRAEFAELVVIIVEQTLGNPIPIPANNPFEDTNDINVLKAWQYGIVNGVSATRFAPNSPVQRQDLCTMVIRAIRQLETDLNATLLAPPAPALPFNDANMIQAHAIEPIRLAYSNGIMEGNALGNFNPRAPISAQECVAVAIRTFDMIEAVLTEGASVATRLDMAYRRVHVGFDYGDTAMGVTRNVTLPTTLPNGATVSWHSSNPGVISSAGVVNLASGAQNVTLTATIAVGAQTRTKAFPLRTSTLSGNQLLMENAFNALDIIYLNANDNADSVTGRIALPTTVLGLPVTWTSNNPAVINNMGIVTVPTDTDARTVTLSALINNAGQTRTKTFTLRVVNTAFAAQSVTLHNVGLGMTPAQVTQALGAPARTIAASATETWQLYHTNYNNFIAVAIIGGRVVGVYSMAPNAINNLLNNQGIAITIAQANTIPGVTAAANMDAGAIYSVMIIDTASPLASTRTLNADGQEQLLFSLVNAFRVRNAASVLEWSQELSTAARQHSTETAVGTPTQTLAQRAAAAGFPGNRYVGGNVLTGNYDAFDFFRQMVATPAIRTEILSAAATVLGSGFAGGTVIPGLPSGAMTYMLGTGAAYAGRLSVTFDGTTIIADSNQPSILPPTLVMGVGETIGLTAATDLAGAVVTWQITENLAAAGLWQNQPGTVANVTAGITPGFVTITASVQTGPLTSITHTFRVEVVSLTVTLPQASIVQGGTMNASAVITPGFLTAQPSSWDWASSNTAAANVATQPIMLNWTSTTDIASPLAAVAGTSAQISATARWNTATHLGSATGLSLPLTVGALIPVQ
jgi:uncharacterized protein YkwD